MSSLGSNEKTLVALWLAAGMVVTGLSLPLAYRGMTTAAILGTAIGVCMLAVGLLRILRRWVR